MNDRRASIQRETFETKIELSLNLEGHGKNDIKTGVGFLDHMLNHLAFQAIFDLRIRAKGDLEIDAHHTVEDVAIVLGQALDRSLGDRVGIRRIGHAYVPMDESLAFVAVDLSGRGYGVIESKWHNPLVGTLPTSMIDHFLESMAVQARMNLHARIEYGRDDHHQAEALFKALGKALRVAIELDPRRSGITSTKGTLSG
jgi:imidazoleglycerol-phosphate dehydratase